MIVQQGEILLGKYRVEQILGQGGMGTVVAARHLELDQCFAIKLLRPWLIHNQQFVSRFMREARAAARLRSPHVARVYDTGTLESGAPYMVMEHLEGCDLRHLLQQRGALPPAHVARLLLQACDGIAEAHAHGIVHRDLKLDNLFLTHQRTGEPCVKVLDFGISKHPETNESLTHSGVLMGSPRYMSPEQLRDPKSVDLRTDIWAMGVIFYELVTGDLPFVGSNLPALIANVLTHEPRPPSALRPELGEAVDGLVMRCLAKPPAQRFADIEALAQAIRALAGADDEWPEAYRQLARARAGMPGFPVLDSVPTETFTDAFEATRASKSASASKAMSTPDPSLDGDRPRVFISCRADAELDVEVGSSFHAVLSAVGVRPFLAVKDVADPRHWVEQVSAALDRCDVFLLLLSERAMVSELVAAEFAMARRIRDGKTGRPKIIGVQMFPPVDEPDGAAIPTSFDAIERIEWRGPEHTPKVMNAVLRALGHLGPANSAAIELGKPVELEVRPSAASVHLELPGGVVKSSSPYYVVRTELEQRCMHEIVKTGALLRIKAPQRMGKTSLMMRILDHARAEGMRVAHVDLQLLDGKILSSLKRFLEWLCAVIARRLKLPRNVEVWDDVFGPKDNCSAYFEDHLLGSGGPLVVAINHIDRLFDTLEVAEEFLTLLRAWHELAKSQEPWHELRLVLAYSTEMYLPMDINHSPFNVGLAVPLTDWDPPTVLKLARAHGLAWHTHEVEQLMGLLGGHPHLIRLALYHIADHGIELEQALATAAHDDGLFTDHVKHLLWHLQKQPALAAAAAHVMQSSAPVSLSAEVTFKLISLGVARMQNDQLVPGRALYRQYLASRLEPS